MTDVSRQRNESSADEAGADLRLTTPVTQLPGVGQKRAQRLHRLGIRAVLDLIRHLPMRYEVETAEGTIDLLPMDVTGSARGTIVAARYVQGGRGKGRFEATLQDHTARLYLVWFNAAYLRKQIHPGMVLRVQGKTRAFNGYPQMVNPKWERLDDQEETPPHQDDRVRPVYPATEGLPSQDIEDMIEQALPAVLDQIEDPLPDELIRAHEMPRLDQAFRMVHQPEHEDEALQARRRLAFNELLLLQLGITLKRHYNQTQLKAPGLKWNPGIDEHIRARFGFELTESQRQVTREIAQDLQRTRPMNRLVQGDVGSGKTVVALYALLMAVADNKQGALMAPTELLAEQHYLSISRMLEGSNVRLGLLTASQAAAGSVPRQALQRQIEAGEVDIVIGTQALVSETVTFKDLAVVVVDEQHRFGVLQRAAFRSKAGDGGPTASPHYLVMTATPIPRTLSLTVFGDLDVSTIQGLPPGRTPIITRVVTPDKADKVYRYLAERVAEGEQAYVVVPVIEESDHHTARELKNVRDHAKLLQDKYLQDHHVAAVHGQLKPQTREQVMERFRAGKIDVLVATTVIEVGVDVPNATMMVVEHAERFGLAQLHQLRGRIGRGTGERKNVCAFIADPTTEDAAARMQAIADTADGFKIAEQDLQIRGMGDFFGTRQHGLPPLRVARIPEDLDLLHMARRDAQAMIDADPTLAQPGNAALRRILAQRHGESLGLIDVG